MCKHTKTNSLKFAQNFDAFYLWPGGFFGSTNKFDLSLSYPKMKIMILGWPQPWPWAVFWGWLLCVKLRVQVCIPEPPGPGVLPHPGHQSGSPCCWCHGHHVSDGRGAGLDQADGQSPARARVLGSPTVSPRGRGLVRKKKVGRISRDPGNLAIEPKVLLAYITIAKSNP